MSMSCLPISASSKSSGTSYTSNTPTATGKSLSSFFLAASFDFESVEPVTITGETAALPETIFASSVISTYLVILSEAKDYALARVAPLLSRRLVFQRHPHRCAHIYHRFTRDLARPLRTSFQNIPRQLGIVLKFTAPLLHGTQQLQQ